MNKKSKIRKGLIIIIIFVQFIGCGYNIRNKPAQRFESYRFNNNSSLVSRVSVPPDFLLSYLKKMDGRPDYTPYQPDHKELKIIGDSLAALPPLYKQILSKRLIGIYFVNNFLGNGLTDWIVDSKNTVYTIMVFNSSVFTRNISRLITEKEKTCFLSDDPAYEISIDCGKKYNGFLYIILHESSHAVDYVTNITPYTEINYKNYMRVIKTGSEFSKNVWADYDTSREHYLFTGRVSFYGFKKPKLLVSEAKDVYKDLARSPFVSLYGSLSWSEDLAELATFYHITHVMKQPFIINVMHGNKKAFSVSPMESPKVKERLRQLNIFYSSGE